MHAKRLECTSIGIMGTHNSGYNHGDLLPDEHIIITRTESTYVRNFLEYKLTVITPILTSRFQGRPIFKILVSCTGLVRDHKTFEPVKVQPRWQQSIMLREKEKIIE